MSQLMSLLQKEIFPVLQEQAHRQAANAKRQLAQWKGEKGVCCLLLCVSDPPLAHLLPDFNLKEAYYDSEKMLVSGLKAALSTFFAKGDGVPSVRANMGCGIYATMANLTQLVFEDNMPWLHNHASKEQLLAMTPSDITPSEDYLLGLSHMRFMKDALQDTGIFLFPMDLQGAVDTAHLIYGDEFFYDLYDDEEFIDHLFDLSCTAIIKGGRDCLDIIDPADFVPHYNNLVLPRSAPLKISEDTSTLLGAEHIARYSISTDNRILEAFGGGYIHYCGDNPHLYRGVVHDCPLSLGLNFGNPERHDLPKVVRELAEEGRYYYGVIEPDQLEEVLRASYLDGVFHLFPICHTTMAEQDEFVERFRRLTAEIAGA